MTRKFLSLIMALFLLASVVVLGEGFTSSLSPFGASIDAGTAYADEDEWEEDEWEPDEDEDDWDDDDRRSGRRRW